MKARSRKTAKDKDVKKQEEMKFSLESPDAEEGAEERSGSEANASGVEEAAEKDDKEKKQKKEISLRQYLLFAEDEKDPSKTVAAFFLQTCPVKAREDFLKRWPSFKIYNVIQSAASDKTASWLEDHDSFQCQLV